MRDRYIKFYSGLSTKEFNIYKNKDFYVLDVISYGEWDIIQCKSLKQCFNIIRSYR